MAPTNFAKDRVCMMDLRVTGALSSPDVRSLQLEIVILATIVRLRPLSRSVE
jgi:hypothetical protein